MADFPAEMNEGKGLPGLLFPFVPHSIETGILQDSKDEMGGFPLYAVEGKPGKVWATKPAPSEAGADAVPGGTFIGIASFTTADTMHLGYEAGDCVNVLKKGRLWVKVAGDVLAGQAAYINNSTGKITASSSGATAIAGGVFKSNASDGTIAELEIA